MSDEDWPAGAELDAWVATAQGHRQVEVMAVRTGERPVCRSIRPGTLAPMPFQPTADWALAGPIIERERIGLRDVVARDTPMFEAMLHYRGVTYFAKGELPLVAAMRAYVRSRFDDTQLAAPPFGRAEG